MQISQEDPQILRSFLIYHETIKGQSEKTIQEYHLDLRMFLRFIKLMKHEMPYDTPLESIGIHDIGLELIRTITVTDVYDFLDYLAHDRVKFPNTAFATAGIGAAARARKLSSIKSFYKYLTVQTKQLKENPVKDLEFPKVRRALPKYLTLEQSQALLQSVEGPAKQRDLAIILLFLNCGIRISELVGLNRTDIYPDRIRVVGKGNKERIVYMGQACQQAIQAYLIERNKVTLPDDRPLFISKKNNRISVAAVQRMVKKHLAAAGLDYENFSPHKLRHTAATLMLSGGVDVKTVQEVLGHAHLNTTEIYTHIENTELKIAAEANPLSKIKLDHEEG